MDLQGEPSPNKRQSDGEMPGRGGTEYGTYVLLGLVAISVFVAGIAIFGSGKFGWTVVALVLSYVLYRYGLF